MNKEVIMDLSLNQLLFRVFHEKDNALRPLRDELGLGRGQPRILSYLLEHGGSSQSDIASSTGIFSLYSSLEIFLVRSTFSNITHPPFIILIFRPDD